jgi:O-antigen ligase
MGLVRNPIAVENEYARILLEQGIIGLLIWIAFISWIVFNSKAFLRTKWSVSRRLSFALVIVYFGASNIGIGMLTAIPGSFIFFLLIGWIVTKPDNSDDAPAKATRRTGFAGIPATHMRPAAFPAATSIQNA